MSLHGAGQPLPPTKDEPEHLVDQLCDTWTLERLLGRGSQGQVWRVRHKSRRSLAAVKLLRNSTDAKHEVQAYEQLRLFTPHPHVLDVAFGLDNGYATDP